jgi:AcrR family transcriptional regulator
MAEPGSRRERKKQETRHRLLEAAWQLFQEKGYDQTAVSDITNAADVAKSTFFNYFPSKESIVGQIAVWRIDLLGSRVLGADGVPPSPLAQIKLLFVAMANEFAPGQDLARYVLLSRFSAPVRHESAHRIGSLVQALVVRGQQEGEIRDDVEPGLVTRLLMTGWFHHLAPWWHQQEGAYPEEGTLIRTVDVLMDGLCAREGRST